MLGNEQEQEDDDDNDDKVRPVLTTTLGDISSTTTTAAINTSTTPPLSSSSSSSWFAATKMVPRLVYVEVTEVVVKCQDPPHQGPTTNQESSSSNNNNNKNADRSSSSLVAALVKQQLIDWSIQSLLLPKSSKLVVVDSTSSNRYDDDVDDDDDDDDDDDMDLYSPRRHDDDHDCPPRESGPKKQQERERRRYCSSSSSSSGGWHPVRVQHQHQHGTAALLDDIVWLESNDPLAVVPRVPVKLYGYMEHGGCRTLQHHHQSHLTPAESLVGLSDQQQEHQHHARKGRTTTPVQVVIDETTLVRVVLVVDRSDSDDDFVEWWKLQLTGEVPEQQQQHHLQKASSSSFATTTTTTTKDEETIITSKKTTQQHGLTTPYGYDESIIRQLQRRPIGCYMVGTAAVTSTQDVRASLDDYYLSRILSSPQRRRADHHPYQNNNDNTNPLLVIEDFVVSSVDALQLVRATCKTDVCHVIRYGPLRARYGVYAADWGLACTIHATAVACAIRHQSLTIVLVDCWKQEDDDSSNANNINDHDDDDDDHQRRMRQYLDRLVDGLKRQRTIVFPDNPLYGGGGGGGRGKVGTASVHSGGGGGVRLAIRMNLIAIAASAPGGTQPRALQQRRRSGNNNRNVDYITIPRTTTVETRLRGLQYALAGVNVVVEAEENARGDDLLPPTRWLQYLAENVTWLRGPSVLARIRHRVQSAAVLHQRHDDTGGATFRLLSMTALEEILRGFGPVTALQSIGGGASDEPRAGGNELAKQALDDAMNPEVELESLGLSAPTGILLYGPPGTGKTLLAKSLSQSMIVLHSTDVAQSAVGQGEKAVLEAFERARQRSERITVIFIDEFQALFTARSSAFGGGSSSSSRVTTTLFQCMDNLARWHSMVQQQQPADSNNDRRRRIIVFAATNTPWMIDAAFLRPGRFDRTIYVGLPSCAERRAILDLHLQTMQLEEQDQDGKLRDDTTRLSEHLAARTAGFSGADLAALCRAAAVQCLLDHHNNDPKKTSEKVEKRHFEAVLEEKIVGPSSDPELVARIETWNQQQLRRRS